MKELIIDAILDLLKILPYLFITFLILEFIEHKLSHKSKNLLTKKKKFGPIIGGLLGGIPQCGFSVAASRIFSSRVITIGTLIAVYLATSDEMLPIMLSENVSWKLIISLIAFKVLVGIVIGVIVDLFYKRRENSNLKNLDICGEENCECHEKGIIYSSIKHTLKISLFILVANLLIGLIIEIVGSDNISHILLQKNILTYFIASLIGLIPNCASSVIITKLYISKLITIGTLLSGLLTGSGLGILILFKDNKDMKENIFILSVIYIVGVVVGIVIDLFF